jgi:hypothetical protein
MQIKKLKVRPQKSAFLSSLPDGPQKSNPLAHFLFLFFSDP